MRLLRAAALFVSAVPIIARAQTALNHCVPAAVLPGQATDVTLFGGSLAGSTGVWTNIPCQVEVAPGIDGNNSQADRVAYRFAAGPETPVGIYGLRVVSPAGTSNLRLIMVDDLPSVTDNGANKSLETAQALTLPVAVDGTCEVESYDFYKFTAAAGQRVSVEAVARRLGSALDPVVRMLDSSGVELAYSDDEPSSGADSLFAWEFSTPGDYYLEIRDIRYQGGDAHRYRMRVGNFPLVTGPYPLAATAGAVARVSATGSRVDGVGPLTINVPRGPAGGRVPASVRYPQGSGSAPLSVAASHLAEQVELEPNDAPESCSPAVIPGAINGRFAGERDRDWFEFAAKAGQRFLFSGQTRSLSSPTDLFLRLYNADGSLLLEAEDIGSEEGVLDFTFPADGTYRLKVEDLHLRGGPEHVYRIEAVPYAPGFTLAVDSDRLHLPQGGLSVAKVTCVRRDYNGPITLSVLGIDGLVLGTNVIPEGQAEVTMTITAPATLAPGTLRHIRIIGSAKIGETDFTAVASTAAALKTLWNGLHYPPADLSGLVALSVGPVFPDFFQLAVEPGTAVLAQLVGAGSIVVKATKSNGFDEPIALAVDGLPPGVTVTAAPVDKGQPQVTLAVAGPSTLAEGDYPFSVVGTATLQNQTKQVVASGWLQVVQPIAVAVTPAGPMAAGSTQKVKLQLTRHGGAAGPVTVALVNLPPGVTAPAEATIPDGQNEIELDLACAADAAKGPAQLAATAAITINNRRVSVASPAASIEIQ